MKKLIKCMCVLFAGFTVLTGIHITKLTVLSTKDKATAITAVQQADDTTSGHIMSDVAIEANKTSDTFLPILFVFLTLGTTLITTVGLVIIILDKKQTTKKE
jgi:hypothetical protein